MSVSSFPTAQNELLQQIAGTSQTAAVAQKIQHNFPAANPSQFTLLAASTSDREIICLDWTTNRNCIIEMLFGTTGISLLRNVRAFEKSYPKGALILPAGNPLIFEKTGTGNTVLFYGSIITRELA